MASRTDYTVGWVCALPVEVAAAKAALDSVHDNPAHDRNPDDDNNYLRGSLHGHNVAVAYPNFGAYGQASAAGVAKKLHASFTTIRFNLTVGIAGGVPDTKEDIRLGDVVVGKSTAGWPVVIKHDMNGQQKEDQCIPSTALDQPTPLALTAVGKAETVVIFDESRMPQYLSEIIQKDHYHLYPPWPRARYPI